MFTTAPHCTLVSRTIRSKGPVHMGSASTAPDLVAPPTRLFGFLMLLLPCSPSGESEEECAKGGGGVIHRRGMRHYRRGTICVRHYRFVCVRGYGVLVLAKTAAYYDQSPPHPLARGVEEHRIFCPSHHHPPPPPPDPPRYYVSPALVFRNLIVQSRSRWHVPGSSFSRQNGNIWLMCPHSSVLSTRPCGS